MDPTNGVTHTQNITKSQSAAVHFWFLYHRSQYTHPSEINGSIDLKTYQCRQKKAYVPYYHICLYFHWQISIPARFTDVQLWMENDVKDEFQRDVRSQDDVIEEDCQGGGRGKRARRPKKAFLRRKGVGEKGISEKGFMRKKRGPRMGSWGGRLLESRWKEQMGEILKCVKRAWTRRVINPKRWSK